MNPAWAALGSMVSRPSEQTSVSSGRLTACLYIIPLEGWLGEPPYYSQADLESEAVQTKGVEAKA